MSRSRRFWNFIRESYLGSPLAVFQALVALVGYAGIYLSFTKVAREITASWPGHREFVFYIAATYGISAILFAWLFWLTTKVLDTAGHVSSERAIMAGLQHKLAEVVRSHVVAFVNHQSAKDLQNDSELRDVLGRRLLDYLDVKLGRNDFSVTVKYAFQVEPGANPPSTPRLRAVFRHVHDGSKREQRRDDQDTDQSVVFMNFRHADRRVRRVIICDTHDLDVSGSHGVDSSRRHEEYKAYAARCGFRSVVAFPLREPSDVKQSVLTFSPILGFLSIDCDDPNAFDKLFKPNGKKETNDGQHLDDTDDLEFLFAVADSVATLAMLNERTAARIAAGATVAPAPVVDVNRPV